MLWLVGLLVAVDRSAPATSVVDGAMTVSSNDGRNGQVPVAGLERLVVYGHSMPAGSGASEASRGYATVAAETMGLTLANRAAGGTSAAVAARAVTEAPSTNRREAVVIHTGMNDIFRRGEQAVFRGRIAIRTLLARTDEARRRVLVLECQPASWLHTPPQRDLQAAYDAWNRMLRVEAARWPEVGVLDTCESWNPTRYLDPREFHPNDDGHELIAGELVAMLAGP